MKFLRFLMFLLMPLGLTLGLWAKGTSSTDLSHSPAFLQTTLSTAHAGHCDHAGACGEGLLLSFEVEEDEDETHDKQLFSEAPAPFEMQAVCWPLAARRHHHNGGTEGTNYLRFLVLRL